MEEVGWLWLHLPPVALLLVQLQLILVNVELLHKGITVGSSKVLVCLVQVELVIDLFLPPPQLATGGIEFFFTLLGVGGGENNLVSDFFQASIGDTPCVSHECL